MSKTITPLYCRRCQAQRTADTLTQRVRDEVCLYVCTVCGAEEGVWLVREEDGRNVCQHLDVRPRPLRARYGRGARGVCASCGHTRVVYPRHLEPGHWCGTCIGQETRGQEEARDV